jgi:hypothetical protein
MIHKMIAVVLIAVLLHGSLIAQTQLQTPVQTQADMQSVLRKAQENDKAVKVTLNQEIGNQRKLSGKVSEVSDASFTLIDQKTGRAVKLDYANIRQVKRKGMSKGLTITLIVIAGVIVGAVVAARPWRSE